MTDNDFPKNSGIKMSCAAKLHPGYSAYIPSQASLPLSDMCIS